MEQQGADPAYLALLRKQMAMEPGQAMHSLETIKNLTGEGSHLEWMKRQAGAYGVKRDLMSDVGTGPYLYGGQNDAGGYEGGFGVYHDERHDGVRQDLLYEGGAVGAWEENGGGKQYGIKRNAGVYRVRGPNGGLDAATAGAELSAGENGIRVQGGATGGGIQGTWGGFDKESDDDTEISLGLSEGPSFGLRFHWGDSDGDGKREWGGGFDLGPVSFDGKTEDPLWQGIVPHLVESESPLRNLPADLQGPITSTIDLFSGDYGPAAETAFDLMKRGTFGRGIAMEQKKNQEEFQEKRAMELLGLAKNKEQMMKEQGPEAYYRQMLLANMPPQMRIHLDAASSAGT
jgi:hypothetical protein